MIKTFKICKITFNKFFAKHNPSFKIENEKCIVGTCITMKLWSLEYATCFFFFTFWIHYFIQHFFFKFTRNYPRRLFILFASWIQLSENPKHAKTYDLYDSKSYSIIHTINTFFFFNFPEVFQVIQARWSNSGSWLEQSET